MNILIAALCGIGFSMLWNRAEPLVPLHNFVIIKLNRLYDWLSIKKLPKYLIWWLKGIISCEACFSPWLAFISGLIMGLGWESIITAPIAFAIYHLMFENNKS